MRLIDSLKGRRALRGVLSISFGTALAQSLVLIGSPVLSRLYEPAEFGVYSVVSAIAAAFASIAGLRWEFAIPLPKREVDAYGLAYLALFSIAFVSSLGVLAALLFGRSIASALGMDAILSWLWVVPLIAAFQAIMKTLSQLAIRKARYRAIAVRTFLRSAVMVVSQVALGFAGARSLGLALGIGVGNLVASVSLLRGSGLRSDSAKSGRSVSRIRQLASEYRKFPLFLAPSGLLNVLGLQVPIIVIFSLFGSDVAGWLGLTQSVLGLPVALLGQAVAQVYLGELANASRENAGRVLALFGSGSRSLGLIALPIMLLLVIAGPVLFAFVFGSDWLMSGVFAQILAPALALQLIAVPVSQTLVVLRRQGLQLSWDAGRLVLCVGGVVLCYALGASATIAVAVFACASACSYAVLWLFARQAVRGWSRGLEQ